MKHISQRREILFSLEEELWIQIMICRRIKNMDMEVVLETLVRRCALDHKCDKESTQMLAMAKELDSVLPMIVSGPKTVEEEEILCTTRIMDLRTLLDM